MLHVKLLILIGNSGISPASDVSYDPTSHTLHSTLYALHPTSYILHPYTPHP